jgi:hypothetical protein
LEGLNDKRLPFASKSNKAVLYWFCPVFAGLFIGERMPQTEPKSRKPLIFRRTDLTRAIKGALAAGVEVARAEIDSVTGKIVLVIGKSDASTGNSNEWDGADG